MASRDVKHQLGNVVKISPEALGVPGQRQFRLLVEAQGTAATLWLEKEQLYQMALLLKEVAEASPQQAVPAAEGLEAGEPSVPPSLEFKVGSLTLGYDTHRDAFLFLAQDINEPEGAPATVAFWASREQVEVLVKESLEVCAAGRPLCALCGAPMGPESHHCPRSNGHGNLEAEG